MVTARSATPSPGGVVVLAIALLIGGGFAALFAAAEGPSTLSAIAPYLRTVLAFALAQAALSTAGALVLGTALALSLARRRFVGRAAFLAALGAAAVLPAIVVVFATVTVYGRSGWLAGALAALGLDARPAIYGWPGILFAHILLNAPFVARVMLDALAAVPAEHGRLAEMLRFAPLDVARHLDLPVIRAEWPGLATLIFLLCFTSFAIVLTLGGGRATLEVAIYEALKADLDFNRAAWLGLLQVAICLVLALSLQRLVRRAPAGATARLSGPRPDRRDRRLLVLDGFVLCAGAALVLPPLASVALGAAALPAILDRDLAQAAATSLAVGAASAALACAMAAALGAAARRTAGGGLFEIVPVLVLAMPPFALAAGLYLIVRRVAEPTLAGYLLLPLVNALPPCPSPRVSWRRPCAPPPAATAASPTISACRAFPAGASSNGRCCAARSSPRRRWRRRSRSAISASLRSSAAPTCAPCPTSSTSASAPTASRKPPPSASSSSPRPSRWPGRRGDCRRMGQTDAEGRGVPGRLSGFRGPLRPHGPDRGALRNRRAVGRRQDDAPASRRRLRAASSRAA